MKTTFAVGPQEWFFCGRKYPQGRIFQEWTELEKW